MIWTHGAWLDVLQGFPADFGPVKIGNNVWLPARNIVLPNVTIGDNSVIGIGSIVKLDVDNEDLRGNHRVTSKSITFSPSGVNLSLSLNKKPLLLSDYITIT